MTDARWQQVERLYLAALECDEQARAALLDEACADDQALRREVESLLAQGARVPRFLESRPWAVAMRSGADSGGGAPGRAEPPSLDASGLFAGRYRITGQIGAGGMGVVYRAEDVRLKRFVALKFLSPRLSLQPEARQQFLREAQAAAALDDPHLCTVFEADEHEGQAFIAMALIEGPTLKERLRDGPLPITDAVAIARDLASGLAAAHAKGVVHRDIKPGNVLLAGGRTAKITDFGLARLERSGDSTQAAGVGGTPAYMSPEQVRGLPTDHRTDIWALGCVIHEMLTGRPPFTSANGLVDVFAIVRGSQADLTASLPPALAAIVHRCLDPDLRCRYQSASALLADLEAVTLDPLAHAVPPRRRRVLLALAAATAVLIPVTAYVANLSAPKLAFEPRDFVLVGDADEQAGEATLGAALTTAFTVSLEQSRHVNVYQRSRLPAVLKRMGKPPEQRIDETIGRDICQRERIRALVTLGVSRVDEQYVLTARIISPVNGAVVRSRIERAADRHEVLSALTTLAAGVRRDLGESVATIEPQRDLAQVTTGSLQALQTYSDGVALWEKGRYEAAVKLFDLAVEEDPGFAKAHAALGGAYLSHVLSNRAKGRQHYETALALVNRLTEREQLSIRMHYASDLGHVDEAVRLFTAYLQVHPDDFRERYALANLLMLNDRTPEAIPQFHEVLRLAPGFANGHVNLATCLGKLGRYAEALAEYDRAFQLEPNWITWTNLNHEYGFLLARSGDVARAYEVFNRGVTAGSKPFALRSLAMLSLYEGKNAAGQAHLRQSLALSAAEGNVLAESRTRLLLAIALADAGNRKGARRELRLARERADAAKAPAWLNVRIAVGLARAGALEDARAMAEAIARDMDAASVEQRSDARWLDGEIALCRGRLVPALEALVLADHERRSAFTVASLARAYRLAGDRANARRFYEILVSMKDLATGFEPQTAWLDAHVRLAELYASAGDAPKAQATLAPLLELWNNADEGLPLRRDALRLSHGVVPSGAAALPAGAGHRTH